MNVIIAHQTFADGDAIGNDIKGMYKVLEANKFNVFIFCENDLSNSPWMKRIKYENVIRMIKDKSTLIIYHHSIFWENGEKLLANSNCKVIIRYHNITPQHYFRRYSRGYFEITEKGRKQTIRLLGYDRFFWLNDSQFNCNEIIAQGKPLNLTAVLPPFHNIEDLNNLLPDKNILEDLKKKNYSNVLIVGRIAPNKGHKKLIQVVNAYKNLFHSKIKFWVVGSIDPGLNLYFNELNKWIRRYGLENNIYFTNKVSDNALKSYFLGSDIFLCLSEHEGFCVPLIEAQFFGLPIVAIQSSAISETIGTNQEVFDAFDSAAIAVVIEKIINNKEFASNLIKEGKKNFESRFLKEKIEKDFLSIINKQIMGGGSQ
ncbi:glycosyltransferase family 4 protein [Cytobacillus firmus]|uniref:glycosyltransferase family 4 protein n=1 Tax=Cytobacillus firmus TaxID=1399 RepID=UPI0024940DFC|nr:glycosyltransferase family 4 protein [Cytobacillus firmus]